MKLIGGYSELAHQYPLHDYQTRAVDFLLHRLTVLDEPGAGLFMDPGLGKTRTTLTAIDLMFTMEVISRVLVLAPLRPLYTVWPVERREWGFPQVPAVLHKQVEKAILRDRPIELMNYGSLKKLAEIKNRWDLLVVDESTYLKNWDTNRVTYTKKLLKTIPKRIILTGTPAANSLNDLFSQMYIVDDGEALGKTVTSFRKEFCEVDTEKSGRTWTKYKTKTESKAKIFDAIKDKVLRMQAEDYLDMPDLVHNNFRVELPEKVMKQYRRFEKELVAEIEQHQAEHPELIYAPNMASGYIKCRQLAAGPIYKIDSDGRRQPKSGTIAGYDYAVAHSEKVKALEELAEMLNGKPLLIGYNFKHELQEILSSSYFKDAGVISGGTKPEDVERAIKYWNEDRLQFLITQWRAASHGLNLQKGSCQDLAAFSLTDSPETYDQWLRRVYRQGQKASQVRVHRIIAIGTVDEVQADRLDGKLDTQMEFLDALKAHAQQHMNQRAA